MEPFSVIESPAVPMRVKNVDTDQIVPARFLWRPRQEGYGDLLFHDLRFDAEEKPNPSFVLNYEGYAGARILVADHNFGCGSSRENAVWALYDYGFRTVIAPSFGDIFFNSSFKNGLLPIILPADAVAELRGLIEAAPGTSLRVDLPAQTVTAPTGRSFEFSVDPFRKELLVAGMDELTFTRRYLPRIEEFEKEYENDLTWL